MISFTPRLLYPQEKSLWFPLDRRLGGSLSRSGRGGEDMNSQPLPGLEPAVFQPLAQRYTAELSRLLSCVGLFWKKKKTLLFDVEPETLQSLWLCFLFM
jgi:hypothetical protein